jgi:hypothetical protein
MGGGVRGSQLIFPLAPLTICTEKILKISGLFGESRMGHLASGETEEIL